MENFHPPNIKLVIIVSYFLTLVPISLTSCGYQSCPAVKDGFLNVHLVPHSHDDMGWLKTVDQYYYGANNSIQMASVQYILDSVVEELVKDPSRRFIYVETGFFWRWWTNQDAQKQEVVKSLVESGRLEFINGGWSMNDEATAHYNEIIDQMSLGLRFLNDTFGDCARPKVAWQIDPFGHSREQASIFAQMGFDGLFFGRLDYQDKDNRKTKKNMEMIWSASPKNLGKRSWLFTSVLYNGYNPPDGFCWDVNCNDDPIMDDPKLIGYNVKEEVKKFINETKTWASAYNTNHVLMTMGSDFQFLAARTWYKNLDKLIKYVNSDDGNGYKINLLYSTPSCYLEEVYKTGLKLEMKRDDFFPYSSRSHSFWTGYFTSRPALKYFIHQTNNFLQVCKHFGANGASNQSILNKIFQLAEPMAVTQHHDAVSGTAKQHVTFDYAYRLSVGIKACEEVIANGIKNLISWDNNGDQREVERTLFGSRISPLANSNEIRLPNLSIGSSNDIQFCHQLNISSCTSSESMKNFFIHIYNPLVKVLRKTFIRVPLPSSSAWKVIGPDGETIPTQLVPLPEQVFSIPGRNSSAYFELVIPLEELQPLSIQTIQVSREQRNEIFKTSHRFHSSNFRRGSEIKFTNNKGLGFTLDGETGLIQTISRLSSSNEVPVTVELTQNFYYYIGMTGNNSGSDQQASGAYIFRPNGSIPVPVATKPVEYSVHRGDHVTEIHQKFSDWVSQVIRLYQDSDVIEFEYLIGPIPIEDGIGKEIVTKYSSDLVTRGIFYTDSNGREILKRERNVRPTWQYQMYEPVSGNYYPVNSRMILTEGNGLNGDSEKTLVLLNDRTQGGTSMNDGEMELMIHRRLLLDDAFGVGEALNETAFGEGLVIRGKHWLLLAGEGTGVPVSIHRPIAQEIYRKPILAFQKTSQSSEDPSTNEIESNFTYRMFPILDSNIAPTLPSNIHLLTYEKLSQSKHLLRLEHFYESGEDAVLSKKVVIPYEKLQQIFGFKRMKETTLGGNQWKDQSNRMNWNPKPDEHLTKYEVNSRISSLYKDGDAVIEFQTMEIKTFVLFY